MIKAAQRHKINKFVLGGNMDKVFIFINKTSSLDSLFSILHDMPGCRLNNIHIIAFDIEFPDYYAGLDIKTGYSWDYLNEEDCESIDNYFFTKLRKHWYGQNSNKYNCFSADTLKTIGIINEFEFINSNFNIVKYIDVINRIFLKHKPKKIIIIEETHLIRDITSCFIGKYAFEYIYLNLGSGRFLKSRGSIIRNIKKFFIDLCILLLDFAVLRYVSVSGKFRNSIIIDHRLYREFFDTEIKGRLLACPFEKGLKIRLEMLRRGLFYLPLQTPPSCFDIFLGLKIKIAVLRDWKNIKRGLDIESTFKYGGLLFWKPISRYVFYVFFITYPRIIANMNILRRFTGSNKTRLIIMRNDVKELERTVILCAQKTGIRNLVILHGIVGHKNLDTDLYADITAVWGQASIDWYRQFGYPESRFVVTGNPLYDELFFRKSSSCESETREKVCNKLKLDPKKKIATFLTRSNYLSHTSFNQCNSVSSLVRLILEKANCLSQLQLIIKLHPYDEYSGAYADIIRKTNSDLVVVWTRDFNVFDILQSSDVVITFSSSSGLEALILDKPLITLDLHRSATVAPYADRAVALSITRPELINSAIHDCLYNKQVKENLCRHRKQFIFDYVYKVDGKSTERVVSLIKAMEINGLTCGQDTNDGAASGAKDAIEENTLC